MARASSLIALVLPVLHRVSCSNETNPKCTQIVRNKLILEFRVQWGGSGAFVAKKIQCDLMAQTCPLIAQVQPILHRVPCSIKTLPNAPKCYTTQENKSFESTWLDRVCNCEKFQGDFMARTCALIIRVQPILHEVLCSNERLPNAPKHYETHPNMSLGSDGADRVRSLPKIPMRVRGTNFCINCTSSAYFAPSFMQ